MLPPYYLIILKFIILNVLWLYKNFDKLSSFFSLHFFKKTIDNFWKYDIIKKIPNDANVEMIQDFGEWKYIIYFEEGSNEPGYGFVHESQLRKD